MARTNAQLPPPRALEAFIVAAECTSFEQAARRLSRSPQLLSIQIRTLEDFTGQTLFHRARRHHPPVLTADGQRYYAQAKQAVQALAPGLSDNNSPVIVEQPNFQQALEESDETIQGFWGKASSKEFEFRNDGSATMVYLRSVVILFENRDGQWFYRHMGRRSLHAQALGQEYAASLVDENASTGQPSGRYSAYDYEVTKIYNKVHITGQPSISDVEAQVPLPDGRTAQASYRRIVLPACDDGTPVIAVFAAFHKHAPISQLTETGVHTLPLKHADRAGGRIPAFLQAIHRNAMWDSNALRPFHSHCLTCAAKPGDPDRMIVTEIGLKHGSRQEFGELWRRQQLGSAIDRVNSDDALYDQSTSQPYYTVLRDGRPVLQLIHTLGLLPDGSRAGIVYYRLLARAFLKDGSPLVVNIARIVGRAESKADLAALIATELGD